MSRFAPEIHFCLSLAAGTVVESRSVPEIHCACCWHVQQPGIALWWATEVNKQVLLYGSDVFIRCD